MDSFFGWTATAVAAYLTGCNLFENALSTNDGTHVPAPGTPDIHSALGSPPLPGGFPASPPRLPLKRRARHQHGSPKRLKVSAEVHKSGSPSSTEARKKRRRKPKSPKEENLETRVKIRLPHRALSTPSTPVSRSRTLVSTTPSSTKDTRLSIQVVCHPTLGSTTPSSSVDTTSTQGPPLPLVADNVVVGRKRPAPAEFDEEVSTPPRKKYITGWMSEYIRLRAPSWREMLRVMQEARWRPFRPQVIRYRSPAPPSAPSTFSRDGCADPTTGKLLVVVPASLPHRAEILSPSPPLPSLDDHSPLLHATTTPPYSPPESPLLFTPPSSPYPEVGVVTPPNTPTLTSDAAYSLTQSVHDRIDSPLSVSRITWADKGKWRVDTSPERIPPRLDQITTDDPTPTATGLRSSLPLPFSALFYTIPEVPPSSTFPTTPPYPLHLSNLRTDRPRYISNSKQSRARHKGPRRLKSTRLGPTKFAYLNLRSQVKWRLQEICRRKLPADRPTPQMKTPLPPSFPPLPALPHPAPPAVPQMPSIPRAGASLPKRLKVIKRNRRFKTTQPKPFKMEHFRLRDKVKWRLKDLGFEKRPPPPPPPPPAIPIRRDQVHPVPVMIGPIPALRWPASVFRPPPPGPVVLAPRQTDWDASTRLSVLASLDSPKRAYRPRRRRKLILGDTMPMEDVEFFGSSL